jgi:phosphotransferase system HPr (HPr) family protein
MASVEKSVELVNKYGFHVRPTTAFVQTAQSFSCDIYVVSKGNEVDGRSTMGLISLGVAKGDLITIKCDGDDAEEALDKLVELVESSFGGIE